MKHDRGTIHKRVGSKTFRIIEMSLAIGSTHKNKKQHTWVFKKQFYVQERRWESSSVLPHGSTWTECRRNGVLLDIVLNKGRLGLRGEEERRKKRGTAERERQHTDRHRWCVSIVLNEFFLLFPLRC